MNLDDILDGIDQIKTHEELKEVYDAANARGKVIRNRKERAVKKHLKVGDVVVLVDHIKPKYMRGARIKVVELGSTRFSGECPVDPSLRRFSGQIGRFFYSSIQSKVKK